MSPRGRVLAPTIAFLATAALFWRATAAGFVDWDDQIAIVTNPHFRGLGVEHLRWMFTTLLLGPYQPLSWMSLGGDYLLWGMNPFGYHLSSVLLHASNAMLCYLVARRLLIAAREGDDARSAIRWGALAAALLFSLHPLRVESVAWVTERRDVLCGFFFLATLLAYLRFAERAPDARGGRRRPWPALLFFLLALLSKASVMTLPIVLILIDVYPLRRLPADPRRWGGARARAALAEKIPFALMAAVLAAVAVAGQAQAQAIRSLSETDLLSRLGLACFGVAFYFWKSLWPAALSPLYEIPADVGTLRGAFGASALFVLLATTLFVGARRRWPGGLAAWLAYLVLLAPVAGVVRVGSQIAADRYSYLPSLAWAILLGGALVAAHRAIAKRRSGPIALVAPLLLIAALAGLSAATTRQIAIWRNSIALWTHAVDVDPGSPIAQYGLGFALWREGRIDEAASRYREAIRLKPDYADARTNLGTILAQRGETDEARKQFEIAEKSNPDSHQAHYNLGLLASTEGDLDEAAARYRRALAIRPEMATARINLAQILAARGETDSARVVLSEGLRLLPQHSGLAEALARLDD